VSNFWLRTEAGVRWFRHGEPLPAPIAGLPRGPTCAISPTVDDKIINRGGAEAGIGLAGAHRGESSRAAMHEDLEFARLACAPGERNRRPSEYIAEMLTMIRASLIANGYALPRRSTATVMYEVHKVSAAVRRALGQEGSDDLPRRFARRKVDSAKRRDPLRLRAVEVREKPGEPRLALALGAMGGARAWHIECSAMSKGKNGEAFSDIHGGGSRSQVFPHHEKRNRRRPAAATPRRFSPEIWMPPTVFLNIDKRRKMSKSLGNFFTNGAKLLAKIKHPEVLRFFLLSSHYPRADELFAPIQLETVRGGAHGVAVPPALARRGRPTDEPFEPSTATGENSRAAMDDDFNTAPRRSRCCRDWAARNSTGARATVARLGTWSDGRSAELAPALGAVCSAFLRVAPDQLVFRAGAEPPAHWERWTSRCAFRRGWASPRKAESAGLSPTASGTNSPRPVV